jgi:hypothetical protein
MSIPRSLLALAAGALTLAALPAQAAVKAALVEDVMPSRPWKFSSTLQPPYFFTRVFGPGSTGILGITSITATNTDVVPRRVRFVSWAVDGATGDCNGNFLGVGGVIADVFVPARSTTHLAFPSAYVLDPIRGLTCIRAETDFGSANADVPYIVNGFLN